MFSAATVGDHSTYVDFVHEGKSIQTKEHCSIEDSRSTMDVFKTVREQWELEILNESQPLSKRSRSQASNSRASASSASSGNIDAYEEDGGNYYFSFDLKSTGSSGDP